MILTKSYQINLQCEFPKMKTELIPDLKKQNLLVPIPRESLRDNWLLWNQQARRLPRPVSSRTGLPGIHNSINEHSGGYINPNIQVPNLVSDVFCMLISIIIQSKAGVGFTLGTDPIPAVLPPLGGSLRGGLVRIQIAFINISLGAQPNLTVCNVLAVRVVIWKLWAHWTRKKAKNNTVLTIQTFSI